MKKSTNLKKCKFYHKKYVVNLMNIFYNEKCKNQSSSYKNLKLEV